MRTLLLSLMVSVKAIALVVEVEGNFYGMPVSEKLTVDSGVATYWSSSMLPVPPAEGTSVGVFEGKLPQKGIDALKTASAKILQGKESLKKRMAHSFLIRVTEGNQSFAWTKGSKKGVHAELEKNLFLARKNLRRFPKQALSLVCNTKSNQCFLKNTGTKALETVDPTTISKGVNCVDSKGLTRPMVYREVASAKQKTVTLAPQTSHAFALEGKCTGRVVVNTFGAASLPTITGVLYSAPLE